MLFKRILAFLVCGCLLFGVAFAADEEPVADESSEVVDLASLELEPYGYTYDDDGTFYVLYEMDDGQIWAVTRSGEEDDSMVAAAWSEDDGIMPLAASTASAAGGKFTFQYETGSYVSIRGIKATYGSYDFALTDMLYNTFNYYDAKLADVVSDTNLAKIEEYLLQLQDVLSPSGFFYYSYLSWDQVAADSLSITKYPLYSLSLQTALLLRSLVPMIGHGYLNSTGDVITYSTPLGSYSFSAMVADGFMGLAYILKGLDHLQTDANTYFSNVFGTEGYSGTIRFLSSSSSAPVDLPISSFTFPQLFAYFNDSFGHYMESDGYLKADGTSASNVRGIGYSVGQGFLGMRSLLAGSETDNVYSFTGYLNDFKGNSGSPEVDSENTDYTGLGPLLNGALSHLSWQVGLLDTVFASPQDLEMKQDSEENMNAVSGSFLKPNSPGSVSTSDIKDMANVSSSASGLASTGVDVYSSFSALEQPDVWSFFTQETESDLNRVPAVLSDDGEEEDYGHAYEDNLNEFLRLIGGGE